MYSDRREERVRVKHVMWDEYMIDSGGGGGRISLKKSQNCETFSKRTIG